ncbi:MAG: hypothetical protein B7C24_05890 [Bacteroidetes bacterium 4572_77]|nr:MAG: hypothetical protein B7C24_05890 [Bacteroidetes bacterium 4572_77]
MAFAISAYSQDQVFKTDKMTFYGLDFTKVRIDENSGVTAFYEPATFQDKYIPAINELLIDEMKRYDVGRSYSKTQVDYDFEIANDRNYEFDIYKAYVEEEQIPTLEKDVVKEAVSHYKNKDKKGLGLLYVVDNINHERNIITIQVVFFNENTGETYLIKRARGEMKGFSIRNYYAGGIRQIIKDTEKTYNKRWKKGK